MTLPSNLTVQGDQNGDWIRRLEHAPEFVRWMAEVPAQPEIPEEQAEGRAAATKRGAGLCS